MDWRPPSLEPNLKFDFNKDNGDLKKHYLEKQEEAKKSLESFSNMMQNAVLEYQKLLGTIVELSMENEKRKLACKNHVNISSIDKPASEVISASSNCNLKVTPTSPFVNKKIDIKVNDNNIIAQKENICDYVQIFTEDFNSDIEEGNDGKSESPPRPVVNSQPKVQNSPILSKSKRHGSKRSNSSILSNSSITSSNDSRISLTPSNLDKNIGERDNESDPKSEKMSDREPLHGIENNVCTPKSQKSNKVLSVSKIDYGKTEFTERGKKLRQSKLTLQSVIPVIDLSKVDSDENFSKKDSQSKGNCSWNETFFSMEHASIKKANSFKRNISDFYDKKECETKNDTANQAAMKINETCEDELVETSPAQNETSKLRYKLSMRKPEINKLKLASVNNEKTREFTSSKLFVSKSRSNKTDGSQEDLKINFKNLTKQKETEKPSESSQSLSGGKGKSHEDQKTLNDETFFSLAELTANKNQAVEFDIDATDFEEELKVESPPAKKMLMSSFDIIPGRYEKSPEYAYKHAPVRKKAERALLPGWTCRDCEMYYDHLPDDEKKKRQNQCSRHRSKYKANIATPESFWNPEFDNDGSNSSSNN